MSEADAKFWYKSHLVLQCDFCELIYNEHDILDKHIFAAHQDQLEPPELQKYVCKKCRVRYRSVHKNHIAKQDETCTKTLYQSLTC